tara:strand:- start:174 stop:305 length:132 start_codon:yes stop_codon:yes gene_type:complete
MRDPEEVNFLVSVVVVFSIPIKGLTPIPLEETKWVSQEKAVGL